MIRSKDLDNIAPDDEIVIPKPVKKSPKKTSSKKKINKIKKKNPFVKNDLKKEIRNILGHSKSSFSSFLVKPKTLTFSERNKEEEIYLALRPHWVNNLPWMAIAILMMLVPFFFSFFSFLNFFPKQYQFGLILFWYLITFIYIFQNFLSWYFNLFLVTNQRVVDIDFKNLLNKHFAEAKLSVIQDVSSCIQGLLGTFFNFGDILIQTASGTNQINFEKVSNPGKVMKLLKELCNSEDQKRNGGNNNG
jgi:hypothetical protein